MPALGHARATQIRNTTIEKKLSFCLPLASIEKEKNGKEGPFDLKQEKEEEEEEEEEEGRNGNKVRKASRQAGGKKESH